MEMMLTRDQANELIIALGHAICKNKSEIALYKCSHCKRAIAILKESMQALANVLELDEFPKELCCPYCTEHKLQLIEKNEWNEEQWEAYEQDLNTFDAKPIINVCHQCAFIYLSFKKDINETTMCPLCQLHFDNDNATHASLSEPVTDKLLDKVKKNKEEQKEFEELAEHIEIPLEALVDVFCEVKTTNNKKPIYAFMIGHNDILKMTIFAIPNSSKLKEPSFTWIKDETIEYIKELPNPED